MGETTTPKERPILFSGPMVRALLDGKKTQTRRIFKPQPVQFGQSNWTFDGEVYIGDEQLQDHLVHNVYGAIKGGGSPYGSVWNDYGDRIWVRETFLELERRDYFDTSKPRDLRINLGELRPPRINGVAYRAECGSDSDAIRKGYGYKWKPSIFMPRWASRILLELTDIDIQRLHWITEADAIAEGSTSIEAFADLWREINGPQSWDANPWVWKLSFKRITPPRS